MIFYWQCHVTCAGGIVLKKELLDILVCPRCKGVLKYDVEASELICPACKLAYPIKEDIPIMLVAKARKIDD
jgi:uncharacterized protein YbaR (Trm112 family)